MEIGSGNQPQVEIGGRRFTDLANLIMLTGAPTDATLVNSTLRKPNATAGYQVPVGKKFVCLAFEYFDDGSATACNVALGYADNDVGVASASALTNVVFMGGTSATGRFMQRQTTILNPPTQKGAIYFEVPAQKYAAVVKQATAIGATIRVWGYELPA